MQQKNAWRERDRLLRNLANDDVTQMGMVIRQHYKWGPRHPEYLALDDIELRLEYYRIRAWLKLEKTGKLPGTDINETGTDAFEDVEELVEAGILEDDALWEQLTGEIEP